MLKRVVTYGLVGVLVLSAAVFAAGVAVKKGNAGRIAPGVTVCGRDFSGMTMDEAEEVLVGMLPETVTEVRCRFLPEMREELEERVRKMNEKGNKAENILVGNIESGELPLIRLTVQENEVCVTVKGPMFRPDTEKMLQSVAEQSGEAKVWEWLYAAVTGRPYRAREAEASFSWEEDRFGEYIDLLCEVTERERQDATVAWEDGQVKVTESRRGYRLETEKLWQEAETVAGEATKRMQTGPVEGLVLRFYVKGTALMPGLTTVQARGCNKIIGSFTTSYAGAGSGRAQNIRAGAAKLHGAVVLPGAEFSVAAALMPFTEENGYAAGGTYIDGQLSESIGGGVCQLSSTLYNALLQTRLEITERHPHSLPVGYVPLGRDAAIAGDYKDLKFKNTTKAPVLLLCEATGTEVKVTVYGNEGAKREGVTLESVVTEEKKDSVTVEVYREEIREDGRTIKEKMSENQYGMKKGDARGERE